MLEYHPEVNYDMTQEPPEPIMDKNVATKAHDWLSGWIAKHWGDPERNRPQPFEPKKGYIRRPDIVVTKDMFGPPVQSNIQDVIEIKFPGDRVREGQMEDYALIAGKEPCFLTPDDCACDRPSPEGKTVEDLVNDLGPAATLIAWIAWLASRGRGRPPTTAPAW
ncbi:MULTISPECIES: VRR-NUC domain-containing protein [Xanthomonas translucens group]|nr:VRR-NUC domain-containing protein [Xanthomonas translucens]UKE48150.1 VRR-NUC domain-containing protein [Xanthomonas translucens pv. cerealis]